MHICEVSMNWFYLVPKKLSIRTTRECLIIFSRVNIFYWQNWLSPILINMNIYCLITLVLLRFRCGITQELYILLSSLSLFLQIDKLHASYDGSWITVKPDLCNTLGKIFQVEERFKLGASQSHIVRIACKSSFHLHPVEK